MTAYEEGRQALSILDNPYWPEYPNHSKLGPEEEVRARQFVEGWCARVRAGIPDKINYLQLLNELNAVGWLDYKIGLAIDLDKEYISQLRSGRIKRPSYEYSARLYNFHQSQVVRASPQPIAEGET